MPRPGTPSEIATQVRSSVFARIAQKMAAVEGPLFPLHIGDTHLIPPEEVRHHPPEEFGPECYRYGPIAGAPELLDALAKKAAREKPDDLRRPRARAGGQWRHPCAV